MSLSRRSFLAAASAAGLGSSLPVLAADRGRPAAAASQSGPSADPAIPASFPSHDPMLAREIVSASHGNVARVRELLAGCPALAKASWEWGYGDWETALGAASHVGSREIADLLIAAGAPPTIFSAAMMNDLAAVKAFVAAVPGIQRVKGPHGITLHTHARLGKAAEVLAYLESLGGANEPYRNEPLADEDRAAILGTYAFGAGPSERLTVAVNSRGSLVIERTGAAERNLFHQGGRVFHPPGAEAVRIRFGAGAKAPEVRVEDGPLVVVARRLP